MPDDIKAPYYSYDDLRRQADKFLAQYHPAGTIPVPIEQIVEFQFRIDIVPTPGLHQLLETDGFITSDLREIWVDQFVYDSRPGRYRFTLAHEMGHVVLHKTIFQSRSFSTIDGWKAFMNSIPDREHGWLEYQAYAFAGLVLVPRGPLETATRQCVNLVRGDPRRYRNAHDKQQWAKLQSLPNLVYTDGNEFSLWRGNELVSLVRLDGDIETSGGDLRADGDTQLFGVEKHGPTPCRECFCTGRARFRWSNYLGRPTWGVSPGYGVVGLQPTGRDSSTSTSRSTKHRLTNTGGGRGKNIDGKNIGTHRGGRSSLHLVLYTQSSPLSRPSISRRFDCV